MGAVPVKVGNLRLPPFAREYIANASGLVVVTFPTGLFKLPPIVTATGMSDADARSINASIVQGTLSATGVTFMVKKNRAKLPTLIAILDLAGYEPDAIAPGTKIHVTATPSTV